jgi:GNAT superfamily N-acetyltransferase
LEARLPIALKGLAAEAKKCKTFAEFKHDYLIELKHGVYWHITKNPNFFIDPETGPKDMSSMGTGYLSKGKLMITSHLDYWADFYKETRKYAALIDMSEVPRNDYYQVNRGFGNEFFVTDPSKAKVVKVMPIKKAIALDKAWKKKMPNSEQELKYFYEEWHGDDYQNFYTELPDIKSDGAPYVVRQIDEENFKVFKNAHEIAHARLSYNGKYVIDLYVQKEYRRKGIASALYKYIENVLGYKLEPSPIHQTDDGEMFWKSRH